jgi:hypothetical protein
MITQTEFDWVNTIPPKKVPRIGRVYFNIQYFVDLNDESMIDHAKECICEDIECMVKNNETFISIAIDEAPELTYDDIPYFLKECCDGEIE